MSFEQNTLFVTFGNGKVYKYVNIPYRIGEALIDSANPVRFFAEKIEGHYTYQLVEENRSTVVKNNEPFMPANVLKSFTRDKDGDLILEMMDGSEYCYYDFPKSLYREMKNFYNTAEFIDRHVKGKYKCEKIT